MNLKFDLSEKEIDYMLFGLCLGDGYYAKNGMIKISHTNKQRFYVEWLEKLCLTNHIRCSVKYDYEVKTNLGKVDYSLINIWVKNRRHFEKYSRLYDVNRKKIVSKYFLDRINLLGLILWYLDDGSLCVHKKFKDNGKYKVCRFAYLNTQSFSYQDNLKIVNMFKTRFDIDTKLNIDSSGFYPDRRYYRVYINATNFRKFFDLLRDYLPYIPKEFCYKFNMKYEPNHLKESLDFTKRYNL